MSQEAGIPALQVEALSKSFTRTLALSEMDLTIAPGEVHALLGQNGSGKSTLIKVLSGYHSPDPGGSVRVGGAELVFGDPVQSYRRGCRFVQQDLGLIPTLSVLDNMALGSGFPTSFGTIRTRSSIAQARRDLARLRLDLDPRRLVSTLTASERTGVAVARALREDPAYPPQLLVLDEPTATLPADEVDALLAMVSHMAATGAGVLYVTHHLGEIFRVAQSVSVLRDGRLAGRGPVGQFDHDSLVTLLAGAEVKRERRENRSESAGAAPALTVRDLRGGPLRGVSLEVAPGEIVGVAGLSGSGRDFILGAIFGARPRFAGDVVVNGSELPAERPDLAIGQGVAYVAPDRKIGGGVMELTARENVTLPSLKPFWRRLTINRRLEREHTRRWFERLSVRPADAVEDALSIFSGGNQQKILFAKWLSQGPSVFLLDEPTQGVDVGAKAELHRELARCAAEGAAVLLSSSDLEELADLCDRVLILIEGRVSTRLSGSDLTEAAITRRFMPVAAVPVA
jgi:ribose transport system ATP-binding protein